MDGVSTAISFVSLGYTAFKKVRELRKSIKDAPEQLKSLEDSCDLVEQLLRDLELASSHLPPDNHTNTRRLERLSERVQKSLSEVERLVDKVIKAYSDDGGSAGRVKVRWIKWFLYKDDFESMEKELKDLRSMIIDSTQPYYFTIITTISSRIEATPVISPRPSLSTTASTTHDCDLSLIARSPEVREAVNMTSLNSGFPRSATPLHCLAGCECRCHYPAIIKLFPTRFTPYTGQIYLSKHLLRSRPPCNVQTCRGDPQRAATVQWILPPGFLHGFLESGKNRRIHFSIGAPRVVSWDSPIVDAVFYEDLQGVRNLFATGKASIWDYTMDGLPVFRYACYCWQRDPTEQSLEIIRLFLEAGAEALLLEETETFSSAHDTLTRGFFTYLLRETSDAGQSLATIVRTNTAAIHIFRSLLNMDPVDALEDYLERDRARHVDVTGFITSLEGTTCNSESRSSVFEAINYTPLGYAIFYSSESVESLLADGEDAAAEPTLVYAVKNARPELMKPLLDAGANVNMRDWRGHTALLVACSRCRYYEFFELLRWAEDEIDWDACTPDGQNALELFNSAARAGEAVTLSQSEIDKFRAVLVAHMKFVEDVCDEQLDMPGAFPDAP